MIRDDLVRMRHMLYTARKAVEFTDGKGREDLDAEGTYSLFVKKSCELMANSAWRISPECRSSYVEIPWAALMAMADLRGWPQPEERLDGIWAFLTRDLPGIVNHLEKIIRQEEGR